MQRVPKSIVLVLSIVLLSLIVDAGIEFHVQKSRSQDVAVVNIAGRQRMLSQRMTKGLLQLQSGDPRGYEELRQSMDLFDASLRALRAGGSVESPHGDLIELQPATDKDAIRALDAAIAQWRPVQEGLEEGINKHGSSLPKSAGKNLIDRNTTLLTLMNDATNAFEREADSRARSSVMLFVLRVVVVLASLVSALWLCATRTRREMKAAAADPCSEADPPPEQRESESTLLRGDGDDTTGFADAPDPDIYLMGTTVHYPPKKKDA